MATLRVARDGVELLRVRMSRRELLVGRSEECDVTLPDPDISRRHLLLRRSTGRGGRYTWVAEDIGSTAGVRVNGHQTRRHTLVHGDRLVLGSWTLAWQDEEEREEEPATIAADELGNRPRLVSFSPEGAIVEEPVLRCGEDSRPLRGRLTVGSHRRCDWRFPEQLEALHFELRQRDGTWLVRDREGAVSLGGHALIGEAPLTPGQSFRAGNLEFEFGVEQRTTPLQTPAGDSFHGMLGRSPAMHRVFGRIARVASEDVPVLVTGETGCGKELVARALHDASYRAERAFIPINCAGLRAELVASELFGHVRGAFTGAVEDRPGAFGLADGGTLFLDEVGELPLTVQATLLRVLETGEVRPVGAARATRRSVRLVAATHRDLMQMVEEGTFRRDLLYRLWVFHIPLPPLRERGDDVDLLARHFVSRRGEGRMSLSHAALERLRAHHWPGNVRGLRNTIVRAAINAEEDVIGAHDIEFLPGTSTAPVPPPPPPAPPLSHEQTLREHERRSIIDAVRACEGNKTAAARRLGIAKSTLFHKLRSLDISSEELGEN